MVSTVLWKTLCEMFKVGEDALLIIPRNLIIVSPVIPCRYPHRQAATLFGRPKRVEKKPPKEWRAVKPAV